MLNNAMLLLHLKCHMWKRQKKYFANGVMTQIHSCQQLVGGVCFPLIGILLKNDKTKICTIFFSAHY